MGRRAGHWPHRLGGRPVPEPELPQTDLHPLCSAHRLATFSTDILSDTSPAAQEWSESHKAEAAMPAEPLAESGTAPDPGAPAPLMVPSVSVDSRPSDVFISATKPVENESLDLSQSVDFTQISFMNGSTVVDVPVE